MSEGSVNEGHEAQASTAATGDKEPPYPSNLYAWYCVIVLLGIYLNSFLDRQILGLLVDPIKETMELSDSQVGFIMGPAFAIFYTIAGLPLGWMADRASRRLVIMGGQLFWSIASISFGLGKNFTHLISARVGVGVGEASLSPSAYSLIADLFPPNKLGRALSVYGMGIFLGGGLANLIGGRISDVYTPNETHEFLIFGEHLGWQIVFFMIAIPTIPLTLMLLTFREPKRRGVGMVRGEDGKLRPLSVPIPMFAKYWWSQRGTMLCHGFGFAFLSFSGYGAAAWLPAFFMRLHGWSRTQVGDYLGLNAMIAGPLGLIFAGWLADRLNTAGKRDSKMRVGLISAIAWMPFGIAAPLMPTGELAFIMLVPATFIGAMAWGIAPAAVQEVMPNQMRGQASATYLFIINLVGLGLGPFVLPLFTDYVFADPNKVHLSLLTSTVAAHVISIVLLYFGIPRFRKSREHLDGWLKEHGDAAS